MRYWKFMTATLGLLCSLLVHAAAADTPRPPNILFIMVDEMRWNAMGCAGNSIVKTPHLDQLAKEGTRFATAYTCSAVCSPSRYSFFTGRYAHVHGAFSNGILPKEPQLLITSILKHYGYETAISGKLHYTPARIDHDFDYFWSFTAEGPGKQQGWNAYLAEKLGPRGQRIDPASQPYPNDPLGGDIAKVPYPLKDYQTPWITDRALEFLHKRDAQKPFFLFVSYLDPHSPSHLPEPYWTMAEGIKVPPPKIPDEVKKERARLLKDSRNRRGPGRHMIADEKMAQDLTANYYATINMVDNEVGRLLEQLQQMGLAENTILVFTADHGNMLGDHGRWFKGVAYEGSARIPLMMKVPPHSPEASSFNAGKVISQIVENTDVMPTLFDIAGLALPKEGIQGKSMVNLVAGKDPGWKNHAFSEIMYQMIRTPEYKLIKNSPKDTEAGSKEPYELYNMEKDPKEETDLAKDPASAQVLKDLIAQLEAWQKDVPPVPTMDGVKPLPDKSAYSSSADNGPKAKKKAKRSERLKAKAAKNK